MEGKREINDNISEPLRKRNRKLEVENVLKWGAELRENDGFSLLSIYVCPNGSLKGPWTVIQLGLMPRKYFVKETLLLKIQNERE